MIYRWVLKPAFWLLLHSLFRLSARGVENVPRGPVIVAASHLSLLDSLFIPVLHARRFDFLAKVDYFESWKTAWLLKAAGQIPLGRGEDAAASLHAALEVLRAGGLVAIYPEGTRSPDGRLYKARTGVAKLALMSGAPVVPVRRQGQ